MSTYPYSGWNNEMIDHFYKRLTHNVSLSEQMFLPHVITSCYVVNDAIVHIKGLVELYIE